MVDKKDKALEYQELLRLYLRATREDNSWSQDELGEKLGISRPQVQNLESPSSPSKPVHDIIALQKFAELRGLTVDVFVAALIGKANEDGEVSQFSLDIGQLASKLQTIDQISLHKALKLAKKSDSGIKQFLEYQNLGVKKKTLLNIVTALSEKKITAILNFLKIWGEK